MGDHPSGILVDEFPFRLIEKGKAGSDPAQAIGKPGLNQVGPGDQGEEAFTPSRGDVSPCGVNTGPCGDSHGDSVDVFLMLTQRHHDPLSLRFREESTTGNSMDNSLDCFLSGQW
jgi:hypothetical protein